MKIHTKSALILLATLALGMLLGALLGGALLQRRMHPAPGMRMARHFADHFEAVVRPEESQRDTVRAILDGYAGRFEELYYRHHGEVEALIDSMRADMHGILTEEQMERLRAHAEMAPHRRGGPPFGRERGPRRFRERSGEGRE
jgi:ABC-type cobalt transport system substrate-binding protein